MFDWELVHCIFKHKCAVCGKKTDNCLIRYAYESNYDDYGFIERKTYFCSKNCAKLQIKEDKRIMLEQENLNKELNALYDNHLE